MIIGRPRRPRHARGSGTALIIGLLGVIMMGAAGTVVVGRYVVADHRAHMAADQAAWAGASAHGRGGDACAAAGSTATRNGAELTRCTVVGDRIDFVVSVETRVAVRPVLGPLPDALPGEAHAGRVGPPLDGPPP